MDNPRISVKEWNLLKGAIRRVFSRSDLRRQALQRTLIDFKDPNRPRVTKWSWCQECGLIEPTYKMDVDHIVPVIPLDSSMKDMSLDELVDRIWCSIEGLRVLCKSCHDDKTAIENKVRREFKKQKKVNHGKD
jgi:5-methylcytosine-specific restriction endonuclease McrA